MYKCVCEPGEDWSPLEFVTPQGVHPAPVIVPGSQCKCSYPSTGSHKAVCCGLLLL